MLAVILSLFFHFSNPLAATKAEYSSCILIKKDTLTRDSLRLVSINSISISGNKKTKDRIILRELKLKHGDTIRIWQLEEILKKDRNKIYNTRLFNSVDVFSTIKDDNTADIYINVSERWYLFPIIIFELADPNFNVWWRERHRDLNRLEYGLRFTQKNFRGRNEDLRATFQFGFTKKADLSYNIPYIDRTQRYGLKFLVSYATNNNIIYKTADHITQPADADYKLRERFRSAVRLNYRQAFYTTHGVELSYNYIHINDTIALLNPNYFLNGKTSQRYYSLKYDFRYDFRDIAAYPLKGSITSFSLEKLGLTAFDDIDQWDLTAEHTKYTPLSKRFFLANQAKIRLSTPKVQPYYNLRALGYRQDFVRGYDIYVIEGEHFFLTKNTLRYKVAAGNINLRKIIPWEQFQKMPFAIYPKLYFDMGYVYNKMPYPENQRLLNKLVPGGGIGLDIVTFYDLVLRLEQSFNKEGKSNFFFHLKADI